MSGPVGRMPGGEARRRRTICLLLLALGPSSLLACGSSSSPTPAASPTPAPTTAPVTNPPATCQCAPGQICVAGSCQAVAPSACILPTPGVSSAAQPIQVLALGARKVGDAVGFTVPSGAASITIVEQVVSAPPSATFTDLGTVANSAVPLTVTDPNGARVFDQFQAIGDPVQTALFFGSLSPGAGTLTLPNTTAGLGLVASGLAPGAWSLVVSDLAHVCTLASNCSPGGGSAAGIYDVTVIVKPGAGAGAIPASGRIDVTLNLTAAGVTPPLTAATAGSDPDLKRMVKSLGTLLARADLSLGAVTFVDVPLAAAAAVAAGLQVDDQSVCGELPQLLATAPAGRQVNIFMVSTFVTASAPTGTIIAGVDGTIPGPATISPNLQSGVAVSAANLRAGTANCGAGLALSCGPDARGRITCCGADLVAYVTAHEIGHFLGLYHVTERNGVDFDPLQDTATCHCASCASAPGTCTGATPPPATPHTMSVAECLASATCSGGDNLMFWVLGNGSAGNVTPEQGRVMRANPAVY
jgi:hypothetical protein